MHASARRSRGLNRPLFAAVLLAAGSAAPLRAAEPATEAPAKLEAFEVTGSRVKRVDYETPVPVITFTAERMDEKGYATLGEFVQSLPYNSATANSEFTTASFITGAATVNPRGLGSNRVLTLVNGRRAVPYALTNSASGTPQTVFNFNSIPASAIDRIEFLKDGASALYGSDAITGVYNLILKKNYQGSSVDLSLSNTIRHDSLSRRLSVFTGLARDGWDITAGFNYQSRHSNFLSDFGVTTTDFRYLGVKGANQNSTIFRPSYLALTAAQATAAGLGTASGYYIINGGQQTANPTKASFTYVGSSTAGIPNLNRLDFVNDTMIYPESESFGGYVGINRTLRGGVTVFSQFLLNRGNTFYQFTPYGYTTSLAGITLPATNPYNPTGLALTGASTSAPWTFRGTVRPVREVKTATGTALAGLRGTLGRGWNWETGLSYGVNETTRDTDLIRAADLQAALNGATRATAFNPFGPSDDPNLEARLYTRSRGLDGRIASLSWDGNVTGSLARLPFAGAGDLGFAVGAEHRRDHLRSNPEPNNFIGFTATTPYEGRRRISAAFLEASLPLQKWLEFQLAVRHERYSDFGETTKPKYSGKLRLPANRFVNVLLRGSWSQSFKAPDIGQLYQPQSFAVTSASISDPLRPQDGARQLRVLVGGNPSLKPEEGTVQYGGA
ncbi:MAG: TonB-dependent receptor plug domain-containing protein, partial [Opitutaceae bacterium]